MSNDEVGQFTLTAAGLARLIKYTGQTEAEVRAAAESVGFVVEDLPTPSPTGMYL